MIDKRAVQEDIERLESLNNIIVAFQEIATTRMQRIRDSVLRNRSFLQGIDNIYFRVKGSYTHEIEKLASKHKDKSSFLKTNGKTVSVLISANSGLYGGIIKKTYDLFVQDVLSNKSDIVIIGNLSATQFQTEHPDINFTLVELSDNNFNEEEITEVAKVLLPYERIVIYHGLFKSIAEQVPIATNVTSHDEPEQQSKTMTHWVFEPSLEEILEYFEKQIFSSNFSQTLREAQLAKLAGRAISLEDARDNIESSLKTAKATKSSLIHREQNRKQLNAMSSMSLWKIK